jgi:hypothetical protein
MKNAPLSLTALAIVCCCTLPVFAQKDTSRIDIGWLSLDKRFTQTLTIKGEDLEKMPFVNLSDAISAWLYGAYTRPTTLAYVVDGNPVTDVNMIPIYEIEEVTLVEQAAGAAAYGGSQQELAVITTRYGKGKSGMRAAAQAGLVNANGNGVNTHTNVYHQYYLSAYRNMDQLSAGVSADWIRDANPLPSGANYRVITPASLERWRLNGYLIWRPAKNNVVELRASYAPQQAKEALDSTLNQEVIEVNSSSHSHLLIPKLSWHSQLLPGLINEFHSTYLSGSQYAAFNLSANNIDPYPFPTEEVEDTSLSRISQLFVRDRMSYDLPVRNWHIDPAINFSYEYITEKTAASNTLLSINNGLPVFTDMPVGPWQEQHGDLLFLTPAVDIRQGQVLDVQLGAQINVSHRQDTGARSVFPFATIGLDIFRLTHVTGGASLKIFGSYAQRPQVFVDDYSLNDFSSTGSPYSLANVYHSRSTPTTFTTINNNGDTVTQTVQIPNERLPVFWTWSAGVSYTTANGRVQLQYTFEKRNFVTPGEVSYTAYNGSGVSGLVGVPGWNSTLHHVDIRVRLIDSKSSSWQTGLNLTMLKNQYVNPLTSPYIGPSTYTYDFSYLAAGDIRPAPLSYTGGWVNRWRAGHFMAGLDVLYHFGESPASLVYTITASEPKINSFMVPNIYAGYNWRLGESRVLELFLDSRGLVRSKSSDLLDERRYYTVGGKLTL